MPRSERRSPPSAASIAIVNNAGTTHRNRPMMEVEEAEFDRIFAVNVKSIFLFAQALLPHMREKGGGVIVNIGSTAGAAPAPGPHRL